MTYPSDSIQSIVDWWEPQDPKRITRGSLLRALVPYHYGSPTRLEAERQPRTPGDHERVQFSLKPFTVSTAPPAQKLPVAAIPHWDDVSWKIAAVKPRPVIVIAQTQVKVDAALRKGSPNYQHQDCFLVAPYFGADQNGARAGFRPELVDKIRHCTYPHLLWDSLPHKTSTPNSILRLDQLQPMVNHYQYHLHTGFRLGDDAMDILDEFLRWHLTGVLDPGSIIHDLRKELGLSA